MHMITEGLLWTFRHSVDGTCVFPKSHIHPSSSCQLVTDQVLPHGQCMSVPTRPTVMEGRLGYIKGLIVVFRSIDPPLYSSAIYLARNHIINSQRNPESIPYHNIGRVKRNSAPRCVFQQTRSSLPPLRWGCWLVHSRPASQSADEASLCTNHPAVILC